MGCEGCARAILLAFNLLLFLVGGACLGVGIWVIVDGSLFIEVLGNIPGSGTYGNLITEAAYIIIAVGAVLFVISFFGCCGAWKKNQCMLVTYAIIIGVLLALQIAVVVVAYLFYDNVIGLVNTQLADALTNTYNSSFTRTSTDGEYTYTSGSIISKGIDAIQVEFSCCGVNSYTDYNNSMYPPTCCNTTTTDLKALIDALWAGDETAFTLVEPACANNMSYVENTKGCSESIKSFVQNYSLIVMIIAGCTLALQILLIIFACCMAKQIRGDEVKNV